MRKNFSLISILSIVLLNCNIASAKIYGGIIEYTAVGKDSFMITVSIYRDCKAVSLYKTTLDVYPLTAGCNYSANGLTMTGVSCEDITPVCPSSCSKCDKQQCNKYGYPNGANAGCGFDFGIEKAIYTYLLIFPSNLSNACCKFRISVSDYYRSYFITTGASGDHFYTYAELDRCLTSPNSSPKFLTNPSNILNVGSCICLSNAAYDTLDFDSLSYSLDKVYDSNGNSVSYLAPYSWMNPITYKGFPIQKSNTQTCSGFTIDSTTGDICFTPMKQQIGQIAVNVYEWRKDTTGKMVQIGMIRRDFALIVMNSNNKSPRLSSNFQTNYCVGDSIKLKYISVVDDDIFFGVQRDSVRLSFSHQIPRAKFSKTQFVKNEYWNLDWATSNADIPDSIPKTYYFTVTAKDNYCPLNGANSKTYSITINPIPKDSITMKLGACGNIYMNAFPDSSYKTIPTYLWQIPYPGNTTYMGQNASVQLYQSGWVKVLHTTKINTCTYNILDSIYIPPFPIIYLPPDTSLCYGDSIYIHAHTKDKSGTYSISWNNNSLLNDTILPLLATKDTAIIITLKDGGGCVVSDTMYIHVNKPAHVNIGSDIKACIGDTIEFDLSAQVYQYKSIQWYSKKSGLLLDTGLYYRTQISDSIKIIKLDTNNCSIADSVNTYIYIHPTISIGDTAICDGQSISYYVGKFSKYNWDNLNYSPIFTTNSPGDYFIWVQDSNGCDAIDSFSLAVNPIVNIQLGNDTIVCPEVPVVLNIPYLQGAHYYYNNVLGSYNYKIYPAGIYIVKCITNKGCITSDTIEIKHLPTPNSMFTKSIGTSWNHYNFYANDTILKSYQWSFGDNNSSTATNPQHLYNSPGNYIIELEVTDSNGCQSTTLDTINIVNGIITIKSQSQISIIPNPASTSFTIAGIEVGNYLLSDMQGKVLINGQIFSNQNIDITSLPIGLYLLQLNDKKSGNIERAILIKE